MFCFTHLHFFRMLLLLTPYCNNHFRRGCITSHTVRRRGRLLGRYSACRMDPSPSDASPGASATPVWASGTVSFPDPPSAGPTVWAAGHS